MKKIAILGALMCLFAVGVFAQTKTDFSGNWTLDKGKSNLGERSRIESMTVKATQTATDLTVDTETKREAPPEGAGGQGGGRGMGGGRGAMMGGGDGTSVYKLDGSETTVEMETPMGKIPMKRKAEFSSDGKLNLSSTVSVDTPNGAMTMVTKEVWELADGGKTLKIKRTRQTPRGDQTMEMVFTKN